MAELKIHKIVGGISNKEIWGACGVAVPERFGTWDDPAVTCKNCLREMKADSEEPES